MSKMLDFIREQPAALRRLLVAPPDVGEFGRELRRRAVRKVWMLGSGTSLYAAMIAAEYWELRLGLDCEAISSLEFGNSAAATRLGSDVCVVAISQSGATFILVDAIATAREAGCLTLGITAEPQSLLAGAAAHIVLTHTGVEDAMGKTKGFSTTAFAACLVGSLLHAPDMGMTRAADIPGATAAVTQSAVDMAENWADLLVDLNVLFVVGSGTLLPAAWEGGLKILEVAKQVVVTKDLEEMLHGPFNGVGPEAGFILLAGSVNRPDRLAAFLKGARAVGSRVLTLAEPGVARPEGEPDWDLVLPELADPGLLPILAVIPLQILAETLARRRDLNPDTARYPSLYKILAAKSIYV
jgi:glucosamine--fructose-6-phosphate aminotransferase (isomerizing)